MRRLASALCLFAIVAVVVWLARWRHAQLTVRINIDWLDAKGATVSILLPAHQPSYRLLWAPCGSIRRDPIEFGTAGVVKHSDYDMTVSPLPSERPPIVVVHSPYDGLADLFALIPNIEPPPTRWEVVNKGALIYSGITRPSGSLSAYPLGTPAAASSVISVHDLKQLGGRSSPENEEENMRVLSWATKRLASDIVLYRPGDHHTHLTVVYDPRAPADLLAGPTSNVGQVVIPVFATDPLSIQKIFRQVVSPVVGLAGGWSAHARVELLTEAYVMEFLACDGAQQLAIGFHAETTAQRWTRLAKVVPLSYDVCEGPDATNGAGLDWSQSLCPLLGAEILGDATRPSPGQIMCANWSDKQARDAYDRLLLRGCKTLALAKPCISDIRFGSLDDLQAELVDKQAFFLTAGMRGFLEHCGCTVNQDGGASRRNTLAIRARAVGATILDMGDYVPVTLDMPGAEAAGFASLVDHLYGLGKYDAIVPSFVDLGWRATVGEIRPKGAVPFAASNIDFPSNMDQGRSLVLDRNGVRTLIIGLALGNDGGRDYRMNAQYLKTFQERLARTSVAAEMSAGGYDRIVVLGKVSPALAVVLGMLLPPHSLIVSSDRRCVAPSEWRSKTTASQSTALEASNFALASGTQVHFIDPQAFWCTVLLVPKRGPLGNCKHLLLRLTDAIPEDPLTRAAITSFYQRESNSMDWRVVLPGSAELPSQYVGSDACKSCHQKEYIQWSGTKHASAYKTLLRVQRHYVPNCVVCHVVGMNRPGGMERELLLERKDLQGVGCEMCHGAGGEHMASPRSSNIVKVPPIANCMACHDEAHDAVFSHEKMAEVTHEK